MIVYRIINYEDSIPCVGSALHSLSIKRTFLNGRQEVEDILEDAKPQGMISRKTGIFVFPNNMIEERIKHWGKKKVSSPGDCVPIVLLKITTEEVQWHNSAYYDELGFRHTMGKYKNDQWKELRNCELTSLYWQNSEINGIEVEGLINIGRIEEAKIYNIMRNGSEICVSEA